MQSDWLVRPKHLAGGDTKQKRVTDLPGGSGDGDSNGRFHTNFLATDLHQPSSEATAWHADETQNSRLHFQSGERRLLACSSRQLAANTSLGEPDIKDSCPVSSVAPGQAARRNRLAACAPQCAELCDQALPLLSSSSRINRMRARSFRLERSCETLRCIRRVQFELAAVPGTLKRYLRASRSVIMTIAIQELHLKSPSMIAGQKSFSKSIWLLARLNSAKVAIFSSSKRA